MAIVGSLTAADFGKVRQNGSGDGFGQVGMGGIGRGIQSRELWPLALDGVMLRERFAGTLDTNLWTVSQVGGGTNFAVRTNDAAGPMVRGTTGAVAADMVEIRGARQFLGDLNCGLEVRFRTDVVTEFKLEIGFVDVQTTTATLLCSDVDTPTIGNGAGDLAEIIMDTTQTLTTIALVGVGSGGLVSAWANTWQLNSAAATPSPTAATWMRVRIQLETNTVHAYIWNNTGALLAEAHRGVGIEGGTVLFPFAQFSTNTGAKNIDLGCFHRWQNEAQ